MTRANLTLSGILSLSVLTVMLLPTPAAATFHFMQIEQATGAVCGDATQQAVQLRMRLAGQNLVGGSRIVAYDAVGGNPVEIIDFPSNVVNGSAGDRVLVVSSNLSATLPSDFTMTNLIPESYVAAGRLTFESSGGTIYWSLAWGGAAYKGSTTGDTTNDADGDFGPPFDAPLPSMSTTTALRFTGVAAAMSTSNAADYAITPPGATFVDNSGTAGSLPSGCFIFIDGFEAGNTMAWDVTVGGS